MRLSLLVPLLLSVIWLGAGRWTVRLCSAQVQSVPECMNQVAANCAENAFNSVTPSNCNWNIIMPLLTSCIEDAISGCNVMQQDAYDRLINEFNITLNGNNCSSTCPDPSGSTETMNNCYTITDTVTGQSLTTLQGLVDFIFVTNSSSNVACPLLQNTLNCLTDATNGCAALMDITLNRLVSMNANAAATICNVPQFSGPTTSEPLAIFNTVTPSTTTAGVAAIGGLILGTGDDPISATTWIALMSASGAVLLIIVVVVGVFIQRTVNVRKQTQSTARELEQQNMPRSFDQFKRLAQRQQSEKTNLNNNRPTPQRRNTFYT